MKKLKMNRFSLNIFVFLNLISSLAYSQKNEQSILVNRHMSIIHESEIGVYFAQKQELNQIVTLDSFLRAKTDSISALLNHELSGKVQFEFYPTQALAEFVCGWDTTDTKRQFEPLGCAHYINKIQLVIPGNSDLADKNYNRWGGSYKVVLHEYIHSFTYSIVGASRINEIPFLITEGIAVYIAQQLFLNTRFKEIIFERIEQNAVPNFKKLIVNRKFIETPNSYHWAFLFINYIVDEYGWNTLLEIQMNYENLNQIVGLSDREINIAWNDYLESKKIEPK